MMTKLLMRADLQDLLKKNATELVFVMVKNNMSKPARHKPSVRDLTAPIAIVASGICDTACPVDHIAYGSVRHLADTLTTGLFTYIDGCESLSEEDSRACVVTGLALISGVVVEVIGGDK